MKELLTGKNKEEFEKWLQLRCDYGSNLMVNGTCFYDFHFEMQIGVLLAYYDDIGTHINVECYLGGGPDLYYSTIMWRNELGIDIYWESKWDNGDLFPHETRSEAYKQAFIKANEIRNKELIQYKTKKKDSVMTGI